MYTKIVSLLKCPCCGEEFEMTSTEEHNEEIIEGKIICKNKHCYPIHFGILDFGSKEQEDSNTWSEYYEEMDYQELDDEIQGRKTPTQLAQEDKFLCDIVSQVATLEDGFLLDIASGRGMLLKRLIAAGNEKVHIISTDLSFDVLRYDRVKFQDVNTNVQVSYIACDATNLPFKDKVIDRMVTFSGYINMMTLMEKGIEEAARVLKTGSKLIDSCLYMDKASAGFEKLKQIFAENDMPGMERICVKEDLIALHAKYFSEVSDQIAVEGIAEKAEGDLLPMEDEWFADAIIICS